MDLTLGRAVFGSVGFVKVVIGAVTTKPAGSLLAIVLLTLVCFDG